MIKILVTGASGLLGANLILEAHQAGHTVVASSRSRQIDHAGIEWMPADLTDPKAVASLLDSVEPDWVVHCAAATDVDKCEEDPAWAYSLNRNAARLVAAAARNVRARLVHISTDAVFDGEAGPYSETDPARPVNVYGESKLAGESAVADAHPQAAIVRTNFFGWSRPGRSSLAEWFLQKLRARDPCVGFTDVWVNPLLANELARMLLLMLECRLSGKYHLGARDCLSKYDFGLGVAEAFGLDPSGIRPEKVREGNLRANRPKRLCLDVTLAERHLEIDLPQLGEGLSRMMELERQGYPDQLTGMVPEPVR